jgi:hypothetical protein
MSNVDMDKLLEQVSPGGEPRAIFREQALRDSLAAFARSRRSRTGWRAAALSAAAVVIAAVSFLLGRCSLPQREMETAAVVTPVPHDGQAVAVPSELVAWLEAARFFRQLGMEDRMAYAVDRASGLLPCDTVTAGGETGPVFAAAGGGAVESRRNRVGPVRLTDLYESVEGVNRIMARCLGD